MRTFLFNIPKVIYNFLKRFCTSQKTPDILNFKFGDSEFSLPCVKMTHDSVLMCFSDEEYEEILYSKEEIKRMDIYEDGCLNKGIKKYSIRVYPWELGYSFIYYFVEFGELWKCYKYTGLADLETLKHKHGKWLDTQKAESFD